MSLGHISMVSRNAFIGLLIFIQVITLSPHLFEPALTYDGGLYAALGQSLFEGHDYSFNGHPGDVPPGFPVLIAPFFAFGDKGMYLWPLLASFIFIGSSFLILEKRYGLVLGFLGALLVFTNTVIYTYSAYILRDLAALAFILVSYLIYEMIQESKTRNKIFLLGLFMGMGFLTKYASLIGLLPLILLATKRKERWFLGAVGIGAIVIIPWSLWSYGAHGTPLISHSMEYLGSFDIKFDESLSVLKIFNAGFFPFVIPLFFVGIIMELKDGGKRGIFNPYILLFVLTLIAFFLWPIKDSRYLLPAIFPVVYFAIGPLSKIPNRLAIFLLALFILGQFSGGMHYMNASKMDYKLLEDGGHWLRDNTEEDSRIMTQSFRQIAFYSQRRTDEIPKRDYAVMAYIKTHNITHILIDSYEKTTPNYINSIINEQGYKVVARFTDGYGEVIIYEVDIYYNWQAF